MSGQLVRNDIESICPCQPEIPEHGLFELVCCKLLNLWINESKLLARGMVGADHGKKNGARLQGNRWSGLQQ
jgi:hypothetical protein